MSTEPRITISRIAAEAGVSVPTVSKVVNGHSDVADETRARVEELIRKYGYRRRADQRSQRSRLLELMFHEIESTWALEIIRGVENVARENGMSVVLAESSGRHTPAHDWLESVLTRRPVGIVSVCSDLTAGQLAKLRSRDIPLVVIDPAGQPGPETPSVGTTNRQGGLAATRHLLDLGHRRIAVIGGPDGVLCGRARIDGYRAALEAAGLAFDPALVRRGDFHPRSGYRQLTSLLALPDRPTGVFAGSDLQALGVYEAARDAGLRIPHDLSVIGFDDLPLACWLTPELTTIRQPLRQMAVAGARLALSLARGRVPESHRIELATSLVVRDSTAPPAGHVPSRRRSGGPR
ncbi:LacI family DNA-binding transcriptional regulator [Amycolatopsis regifaucium]|uniref:LacI family transcriptional regulator n=1 Tax=Amycolatopsis regifaucium TaxID=546365 RepID=A0A154MNU5_9PSEU|nr:LacI family DNA-binding transcriptional regulator [Amycolatopsis regifaucium]KZB85935.1 LacI family transcriptional regulator [Amycolatopsis regifaucium]OKA04826.1 LacI family transcriptional regulator [Amycolatopsis regifaucium]SFH72106.1 transcriptional regulator, LacI family [Amycolatopsis regifaucium]